MLALEALLRLAWQADRDGRVNRRDALLTLAAAEAPTDAPWRERCRLRLARSRPDHPFANFPSLTAALADSRVARGLRKLRDSYLPGRLRSLLALDAIRRGPFTGHDPTISIILTDLFPSTKPSRSARSLQRSSSSSNPREPAGRSAATPSRHATHRPFDFELLLAIAILIQTKPSDSGSDNRAA